MEKELLHALKEGLTELEWMTEGEVCQHNANLCWCGTFRVLDLMRETIAKAESK